MISQDLTGNYHDRGHMKAMKPYMVRYDWKSGTIKSEESDD